MEHRYYTRLPLQLEIELSNVDGLIGYFKTCDLSQEGVGIQGNFVSQKINTLIRVKFIDPRLKQVQEAKGQVVYRSVMKMGLIFTEDQSFVSDLKKNLVAA